MIAVNSNIQRHDVPSHVRVQMTTIQDTSKTYMSGAGKTLQPRKIPAPYPHNCSASAQLARNRRYQAPSLVFLRPSTT